MPSRSYWLTRFVLLRLLGLVYVAAFISLARQILPLIGHDGLLPADVFLDRLARHFGSRVAGFLAMPSLFWLDVGDRVLAAGAWLGGGVALLAPARFANAPRLPAL